MASSFHALLDSHYHIFYQEIKTLFDLLNPDKDTSIGKRFDLRERLDREFWLIRKLSFLLERANFMELHVPQYLTLPAGHKVAREKIKVSLDVGKYAVLKFWVLGEDLPPVALPWYHPILVFILERRSCPKFLEKYRPRPFKFYKRVITAVRLKTDCKLTLRAYRDVPIDSLEKLLPHGRLHRWDLERYLISGSLSLAALGVVSQVVVALADVQSSWPVVSAGTAVFVAMAMQISYYRKVANFLSDTSRTLYFKTVASNHSVLNLVVRRAEEELFKEMFLTYAFLLRTSLKNEESLAKNGATESISYFKSSCTGKPCYRHITRSVLEASVEDWVFERLGVRVHFDAGPALIRLEKLGLLRLGVDDEVETINDLLPPDAALAKLPGHGRTIAIHALEDDLLDGYDKDLRLDDLMAEEKRIRSRYGWK